MAGFKSYLGGGGRKLDDCLDDWGMQGRSQEEYQVLVLATGAVL